VGVRELTKGAQYCFSDDEEVEDWLEGHIPKSKLLNETGFPGLFAYPGQSNMTGRRLPLSWTAKLRNSVRPLHQDTYSLLDAAALATTTQLDFSDPDSAPDFTALSFYKIFGFPDLGALIVRRNSGGVLLWRKYFGGSTVNSNRSLSLFPLFGFAVLGFSDSVSFARILLSTRNIVLIRCSADCPA